MQPLVSIIVPCYNSERFVEEALRSALAQTYPRIEVVVIDDGSTDGTPSILERYTSDPRVHIVSQANAGLAAARNAGLAVATGEYVTFLDSDDVYLPEKVEKQVRFLADHPDAGLAYCHSGHFFDGDPKRISYSYAKPAHAGTPVLQRLRRGNIMNVNTVMVRKALVDAVGGFDPQFRSGEDWDLWIRLAQAGCLFGEQEETLVATCMRADSLRSDLVLQKKNDIRIYEKNFHARAPLPYRIRLIAARMLSVIPSGLKERALGYYRMTFVYRHEH